MANPAYHALLKKGNRKMGTPYIGFGNEQLKQLPSAKEGMLVECKKCGKDHPLRCGKDEQGNKTNILMFYKCDNNLYLGAINGKLVFQLKPGCSGEI